MIPYGRQDISEEDIKEVVDVLKSDFLTQGPQVPKFENAIKQKCDVSYAVAVNSATSALHIACLALNVGKGDMVWTSPVTFVASSNCALYCGAEVDFVDIDISTYNMCALKLKNKLEETKISGEKMPKVVIPVHLCGLPCDMEEINLLSREYGFAVIEDASHAIGGKYQGQPVGNCKFSDITIFSFHPVKIITSAEGGMAVTNDQEIAEKMSLFRNHGITRDTSKMSEESHGPWYYQQIDLGFNYRLTDVQAALGCNQTKRLDEFVSKRHNLAKRYTELLKNMPLTLPIRSQDSYSGLHLYVVLLNLENIKSDRLNVFNCLRENGVGVNVHYIPVHLQPYYKKLGFSKGDFPIAENYYERALSLPIFHHMTEFQQDKVIEVLDEAIK